MWEASGIRQWASLLGCSALQGATGLWKKRDREHLGYLTFKVAHCPPSASAGTARVHAILRDLGLNPGALDAELVQHVCAAVCTRAAQLCAAALAAVLTRLQHSREQQKLQVAVAIGGRVFEHHPRYLGNTDPV